MNSQADLTRWNRAGLVDFRYVDGNAATFLEELRAALADRFPGQWDALRDGVPHDLKGENAADRIGRLLEAYHRERGDWGWEIGRAFIRACHILAEHLDAYANEGFIGTASQWENVRRLVEMLDYHPAPPASASTPLVIRAKEPGAVESGFQAQHSPREGGAPIVFETLEEVEVDPAVNALRVTGWNRSPQTVVPDPSLTRIPETGWPSRWIVPEGAGISVGQPGIMMRHTSVTEAAAVRLKAVDLTDSTITFEDQPDQPDWHDWTKSETTLLAKPEFIKQPRLNGPRVVAFREPHGLSEEDVVAWQDTAEEWVFDSVAEVDERAVRLAGDPPSPGTEVFRAFRIDREAREPLLFTDDYREAARPSKAGFTLLTKHDWEEAPKGGLEIKDDLVLAVLLVPKDAPALGTAVALAFEGLTFDGKPGGLVSGQWAVAVDADDRLRALQIASVTEGENSFRVAFAVAKEPGHDVSRPQRDEISRIGTPGPDAWQRRELHSEREVPETGSAQVIRLSGLFEHALRPYEFDYNRDRLSGSHISLDLDELAHVLVPGRRLLIARSDDEGGTAAFEARTLTAREATSSDGEPSVSIDADPAIPVAGGFTVGNTVVYGNVVASGHGETRPDKILGSGDATHSSQSFVLKEENISFVADPTQPSGVRADIDVHVEGRTWEQVANLRDSGPADSHYAVRITEDDYLQMQFGDGRRGRRLTSGANNVRVSFRVGAGLEGNIAPGSLDKVARPHPRVDSIRQPLAATGGNDMEPVESMRVNGPASLLTLERAVSLADFAALAARQASVWQAKAFALPTGLGRRESIEVVVVPAGGGALGNLAVTLRNYLEVHAPPGVEIQVSAADALVVDVEVCARVRTAEFVPETVLEAVKAALIDAFSLRQRRLGRDLFLSEVYQVVESVPGVENSWCVLEGDPGLRRITGSERQVLFMEPGPSLILKHEEYSL